MTETVYYFNLSQDD